MQLFRLGCVLAATATAFNVSEAAPPGPPNAFASRGVGGGGALFAPSFSPHAAQELYVACDMSELFHTTDLGKTWAPLDFRKVQGNRGSNVQFTSDPSILYTIDYSPVGPLENARPAKSNDGGATWKAAITDPTNGGASAFYADPASTQRLIVTDYANLYFSADGGATWHTRYAASDIGAGLYVGGVFWDGANIYLGTNDGLLVSTNNGASFGIVPVGGLPAGKLIGGFAGAKSGATTRFVCTTYGSGDIYSGVQVESVYGNGSFGGVFSLDLGQGNWTQHSNGITAGHEPFFVAMARANINTIYLAGRDANTAYPIVYKTTNGGANWNSVLATINNANVATGWQGYRGDRDWSYGEEALGFTVAPDDINRLAFTDFGYVHLSTDGGTTWRQAYVAPGDQHPAKSETPKGAAYHSVGLEDTTAWGVTFIDAEHMFAGFSDIRGIRSIDGGTTWSFDYTGHTDNSMYRCVKDIASKQLYAATGTVHDLYQSTTLTDDRIDGGGGKVITSTDLGATWTTLHDFGHVVSWVATDPKDAKRLYASVVDSESGGIYTTPNANAGSNSNWTKLTNPPRTEGHPFNIVVLIDGTLVASYSARRANVNGSTQFTASSGVFVSSNGGQTWSDRSDPGMLYWTKDIVIDPHDPAQNTWFACVFSGYGGAPNGLGGLYRTRDRGLHWTRINATDRVGSCTINPAAPGELYFTSEIDGLWYTADAGAASPVFKQVAAYPFRQPERVFFNPFKPNELWVTSFGNGLRVGTIPTNSTARPLNISTRVRVGTGEKVMIGGFIITGSEAKKVIIRALGPSLQKDGVKNVLANPVLELRGEGPKPIASNDNWQQSQEAEINATGIPPKDPAEAAIVWTLMPGSYTAIVSGQGGTSGTGLVEVYDLGPTANSQLANISTRGSVTSGDDVLVGGFILGPESALPAEVAVRALGPSLAQANIQHPLSNPTVTLYDSNGTNVRFNNDWRDSQQNAIANAGLAPDDPRESALIETLAPGAYTAIVRHLSGSGGIGLVEVYRLH